MTDKQKYEVLPKRKNGWIIVNDVNTGKQIKRFKTINGASMWIYKSNLEAT